MVGQDAGYALGVDLGTSNTVAVLRWPDGRTRALLFDGQPIMPSGVFLDGPGQLYVGRDAQRLAQADPARYEPNPKRRIDEPAVLLGDREVPTVDLLAAILRVVAHAAVEAVGFLPPAAVTYPASWGARRREALTAAVARAGWPPGTRLVPEPVAAARYFAEALRRPVPVGSAIVVFDLGGGTLDIAVVRNEGTDPVGRARFVVIGSGGVAELGGLDLDSALVDHLGRLLGGVDPRAWHRLSHPATASQWRNRRRFWDDVRGAKEMLSRTAVAPVSVPGFEQAVHVTRDELERLAGPLLRQGVLEAASVLSNCRLGPDQIAGLFLVGGSSRVPLVARMLHAELGIAPTVLEQPELPVAEGALAELVIAPVHASGTPLHPAPVAIGASAPHGQVGPAVPHGQVGPAVPSVGPPAPHGRAGSPGPGSPDGEQGDPGGWPYSVDPAKPTASRKRRTVWISVGAAVALVGVLAAAIFLFVDRGYRDLDFQDLTDVGRIAAGEELPSYVYTTVRGDRAYLAYERQDKRLEIIAVEASTARQLWRRQTSVTSERWSYLVALPNAVVAFAGESSDSAPRPMIVFDPANGNERWSRQLLGKDAVYFFKDVLVHAERAEHRLVGLRLRDGRYQWDTLELADDSGQQNSAFYPVTTADDLGGPASIWGWPLALEPGDDQRIVEIGADRSARVIDATTGRILTERSVVADSDDVLAAHGGRLYVANADAGYRVLVYDLKTMGEPVNIYTTPANDRRPTKLTPCGDERICLLESANFDKKTTELVMVDAVKGGAVWRKPVADAKVIVPVGQHVMAWTDEDGDIVTIFNRDGGQVLRGEGVAARLDGGNLLLFAKEPSSTTGDTSVAGIRVSSDKPVQLGPLTGVRSATCSWSTAIIVCAADSDFVIQRFAVQ